MIKFITTLFAKRALIKVSDKNKSEIITISRPILKPYSKDRFELVAEYTYDTIKVPKEYKTNGANTPRLLWWLFPPNSPEYLSAIVVHDYLCDKEEYRQADEILKQMMIALNCSRFKVNCFYYSCRVYHKLRYREYRCLKF
ncbi:DUF1353 domain-containing protein [Campylobacter sp. faydin G-140]|uniref:DUF1353 domain-containing protein n=1 Tax=Campylobacter anatolicus TaxID=2829105 RepID=UPI001B9C2BE5|nr:DUF1353 domain-containing protein [Campylobacter anatolicus]MBR8466173.1 DUF1353 domain-containing protein [Campylobacter anatolicus]